MTGKPNLYAIVGMKHRPHGSLVGLLTPNEPITLVRENHPKDPNAIQVWARGYHVGYIPSTQNKVLAKFIDANGKPWTPPEPIQAFDAKGENPPSPPSTEVFRALDAKMHVGSNTYPLIEV